MGREPLPTISPAEWNHRFLDQFERCVLDGDIGGLRQLLTDHPHPDPRMLLYYAVVVTGESFDSNRFDVVVPEILEGILQYLLDCGAEVNFTEIGGRMSVLLLAMFARLTGVVVEWLLNHGAIVHTSGVDGVCPIHWAARCAEVEIVGLLLSRGADAGQGDEDRSTPLHYTMLKCYDGEKDGRADPVVVERILERRKACVRQLVAAGGDINQRNLRGETPLDASAFWSQPVDFILWLREECGARRADELTELTSYFPL